VAGCPALLRVFCEEGGVFDSHVQLSLRTPSPRCPPERSKTIRKAWWPRFASAFGTLTWGFTVLVSEMG